ncbi:hypothetical protein [Streptomyces sp. NBC_01803]|uniref:hypothetical protein n=1 Tax=Streptomyces sp. NBC_01803 TaxID=2975946 RepID=UPI002DDB83C3|nr:hypothetical protein [Streptomyces sp. NBC_01803]WSA43707.1 hypothetical protein OIE51_05520 [Streptomyces sp. NBC_01803]
MLTLPATITGLDEDTRRVLGALSVLHSPWDRADMEVAAGEDVWRALPCLDAAGLVDRWQPYFWRWAPAAREAAAAAAREFPDLVGAARRRWYGHLLRSVAAARDYLTPHDPALSLPAPAPGPEQPGRRVRIGALPAWSWLGLRRMMLPDVIREAAGEGEHLLAARLAEAAGPALLEFWRDYTTWTGLYELALEQARAAGDTDGAQVLAQDLGAALAGAGHTERSLGVLVRAGCRHGSPAPDTSGRPGLREPRLRIRALAGTGRAFRAADPSLAVDLSVSAAVLADSDGSPRDAARAWAEAGLSALAAGRPDQAVVWLTQARAGLSRLGGGPAAAWALAHLGYARAVSGSVREGDTLLREAENEFTSLPHMWGQIACRAMRGAAAAAAGHPGVARLRLEEALRQLQDTTLPGHEQLHDALARLERARSRGEKTVPGLLPLPVCEQW